MNNDLYAEWLVKQNDPKRKVLIIGAAVALVLVGALAVLMFAWGLIVGVGCIVAAFFVLQLQTVEYEYIFVTDELQVTPIINQQRRRNKKKVTIEMEKVELAAPMSGHDLDPYLNNQRFKKKDYSSGLPDAKTYGVVVEAGTESTIYIIEPNEKILNAMRSCSPRKVIIQK